METVIRAKCRSANGERLGNEIHVAYATAEVTMGKMEREAPVNRPKQNSWGESDRGRDREEVREKRGREREILTTGRLNNKPTERTELGEETNQKTSNSRPDYMLRTAA